MNATTTRIYLAALIGVLVAVAAILTIGLSGAAIGSTPGGTADRVQAQAEESYLEDLGDDAPDLWDMPYADGVDPDTALTDLGHRSCAAATELRETSPYVAAWPAVTRVMTNSGFEQRAALAITVHAKQNLCPTVG